jgi:hypothetical protein
MQKYGDMENTSKSFIDKNIAKTLENASNINNNRNCFLHRIAVINNRIRTQPMDE